MTFVTLVAFITVYLLNIDSISLNEKVTRFVSDRNAIISEQIMQGNYACCMEKPCTSCIALTPYHGEGSSCSCLEDVVTGQAPCGECVGGILAGRGNKYLAKYFAQSIAEGVGEQHLNTLKQIISAEYNITIDEQV